MRLSAIGVKTFEGVILGVEKKMQSSKLMVPEGRSEKLVELAHTLISDGGDLIVIESLLERDPHAFFDDFAQVIGNGVTKDAADFLAKRLLRFTNFFQWPGALTDRAPALRPLRASHEATPDGSDGLARVLDELQGLRGCSIILNEATNIVLIVAIDTAFFHDDVGFLMENEAVDTESSTNDELWDVHST